MTEKRKLAFYKESGEPWTPEEVINIRRYCGDPAADSEPIMEDPEYQGFKWCFDDGDSSSFMYMWSQQEDDITWDGLEEISYESVFHPTKLQGFRIKDYL